ncbi:SulP family inorganic anion transporter [Rufibacter glacialis]|uniref:SulP family inorganic anion transporter n=1 Tax=Rufibacter glacialis TaxID=1259555 RepID=A0A5M8QTJ1_9BACT|nr:SulP family inorganic anion transporter [Rufibacter glacialis]KAA6438174.1 SulP family inorganic anion transporter [Rufibacter glacialis]GGK89237.1 sodium-independent anion transporter [Rufibacter glacialis]
MKTYPENSNGGIKGKPAEDTLPGEVELKHTVEVVRGKKPKGSSLKDDANAGLTVAMNEIPDGMACGLLAGVSPIMGLFASICGCLVGGIFNSSKLMVVSTTSAAAFLLYQLTQTYPEAQRPDALVLLVLLSGGIMILMGLLKLGNLVRFVSYSVMIGFLAGISILTILSQLPTLFAIPAEGSNKVLQTVNLVQQIDQTNWHALVPGLVTIVFMLLLPKTPLGNKAAIVAIALPSLFVFFMKWTDVEVVSDVGEIPSGLPPLQMPDFSLLEPALFSGALSLALITLIQAAGVSQSVPNPDGSRSNTSKDFISQGIANLSSSTFGGIGVGGSLGSTSLNIVSEARSRWAGIFAGVLVLALVLLLPGLVGQVAMPVLAAVMIFAMASSLKMEENKQVWNAGWASRIGLVCTFFITLFLPVQYAVLVGVLLSFILYFFTSSRLVKLHRRQLLQDGLFEEIDVPAEIENKAVHIFAVDGDLHFAGARMLENQWPKLDPQSQHPVIILELRGRNNIGATLTEVIENFYERIQKAQGRFYITELGENSYDSFRAQANTAVLRGIHMRKKEPIIGKSTRIAVVEAQEWLASGAPVDST